MKLKRLISALLLFAMLLSCLPLTALAVETGTPDVSDVPTPDNTEVMDTDNSTELVTLALDADTAGEHYFCLSAQTTSTSQQLLIRPTKVYYDEGDSIAQALLQSGYSFADLDEQYSKFISKIQNVDGNFTYCGDFPEAVTLLEQASSIHYLYFSESTNAQMTSALQSLMQVAADYLDKPTDVQAAAKAVYDEVLAQYPGQTEEATAALVKKLSSAIQSYEDSLTSDPYSVAVEVLEACTITAVNEYGREFPASGSTLRLPAGTYTIEARADNRVASRKNVAVPGTASVELTLPTGNWFDEDRFQISRTYESMDAEDGSHFTDGLCATERNEAHTVVAQIPDAYAGELYPYVPKAAGVPANLTLTASYRKTDGTLVTDQALTAGSYVSSLRDAVRLGTEGNEVLFRLTPVVEEGVQSTEDCVQSMELKLVLARVPTLKSLRVENAVGVVQAADQVFSPLTKDYTYKIVTTDHVKLRMEATTSGSTITVTSGGKTFSPDADGIVSVPVLSNTDIVVTVSSGRYAADYTLHIRPGAGKTVKFRMDPAVSMTLVNRHGEELGYTSAREGVKKVYTYTLVPGEEYAYVATKNTYYHTSKTLTLDENASNDSTFDVAVNAGDWMDELALGSSTASGNKNDIPLSPAFAAETHRYTATVSDATNALYVWTKAPWNGIAAIYPVQSASRDELPAAEVTLKDNKQTGTKLPDVLLSGSGHGNTVTFRVSSYDSVNDVTNYADYEVELQRSLSLRGLTVSRDGEDVTLWRSDGKTLGYVNTETAYSLLVPAAAPALDLLVTPQAGTAKYGEPDAGYAAAVNGEAVPADGRISVPLRGDGADETIRIVLTNRYAPGVETVYTIQVRKVETQPVRFDVTPADALVYVYEPISGNRVWPEDGVFALSEGYTYQCTVTMAGYVGQRGELTLENGVLTFAGTECPVPGHVTVALAQAAKDSLNHDLPAEWPDFRGNPNNNAVTDARIPITAEDGTLYWAAKLGDSYGNKAVSSPILVNGALVVYAANKLYRVDKDTGKVLASGEMISNSDYAINSPVYADGMLLVGLTNGRIQAFDAVTLESLWIYTDPLGGQSDSPITVAGGYAYTGFWNNETRKASFVCVSLTDEDPEQTDEAKAASWRHVQTGGFYWAGAYACEDYVLVGTDDGQGGYSSETGSILLLDAKTGEILDTRSGIRGDVRSTFCYADGAYYATSKGGDFIQVTLAQVGGRRKIDTCRTLPLKNGTDGTPMSTSTPVVYKGRAYIGVSGSSQFGPYSGHNITVIDLEGDDGEMSIAYSVPTQGYPQTSGLLTTAYEETGYVYVYFFDNYTPGTMRVLRDRAGQKEADTVYRTAESYQGKTYSAAYALFTPSGGQAQYCICSPIVDENGTIYFKNDSGYLMAYGSALTDMTVTKDPDKKEYAVGETFEPKGLTATGTFANGVTRNVTKMLSFPTAAIREDDEAVSVGFGGFDEMVWMYHNASDGAGGMQSGVKTWPPVLTVPITVKVPQGDLGGLTWRYAPQSRKLRIEGAFADGQTLVAACYDANGRMIQLEVLNNTDTLSLNKNSAKLRLFLLGADGAPACAAATALTP